mgnify:CR=1 FL=1
MGNISVTKWASFYTAVSCDQVSGSKKGKLCNEPINLAT